MDVVRDANSSRKAAASSVLKFTFFQLCLSKRLLALAMSQQQSLGASACCVEFDFSFFARWAAGTGA